LRRGLGSSMRWVDDVWNLSRSAAELQGACARFGECRDSGGWRASEIRRRRRRHRTPTAGTRSGARRRAREGQPYVLNTCTVTAAADQDARAAIRRIHRKNPDAQIVVTGCYAQRAPEEIAALPGVTQVIGNSHKHLLAELASGGLWTSDVGSRPLDLDCQADSKTFVPITQLTSDVRGPQSEVRSPIFVSDIFAHTELQAAPVFDAANERTRPNLKVQDGCDNRCSFCVIPYCPGTEPFAAPVRSHL